jgi:hypothetical protein
MGILVFIVGFYSLRYSRNQKAELLAHKGITTAIITKFTPLGAKSGDDFEFTYSDYNSLFKGTYMGGGTKGEYNFVGKQFPVVYDSLNPGGNFRMLISPDDFKYYNMPFPDSLKWVLSYCNNSFFQ